MNRWLLEKWLERGEGKKKSQEEWVGLVGGLGGSLPGVTCLA